MHLSSASFIFLRQIPRRIRTEANFYVMAPQEINDISAILVPL